MNNGWAKTAAPKQDHQKYWNSVKFGGFAIISAIRQLQKKNCKIGVKSKTTSILKLPWDKSAQLTVQNCQAKTETALRYVIEIIKALW